MEDKFWNGKRVLVTGASGFIGSHILDEPVLRNAIVTAAIRGKTDLLDYRQCKDICKQQDIVLHFAALDGGFDYKVSHAQEIYEKNLIMTKNLLQAAEVRGVERFLLMSSTEIYTKYSASPLNESDVNLYASSELLHGYVRAKQEAELLAQEYIQRGNLGIAIARLGNVYGPRDNLKNGRVIPTFISLASQEGRIKLYGNGSQKKSFLYITDAVSALLRLTELICNGEPVNIASSAYISIAELAQMICNLVGKNTQIIIDPEHQANQPGMIISIAKARKVLGFQEKVTLREGLASTIGWDMLGI